MDYLTEEAFGREAYALNDAGYFTKVIRLDSNTTSKLVRDQFEQGFHPAATTKRLFHRDDVIGFEWIILFTQAV